jgi:hypothetical protein
MRAMQSYTILPSQNGQTYTVATKKRTGGWQTIREFTTLAEAEAWITQEERLNDAANPFRQGDTTTKRGW